MNKSQFLRLCHNLIAPWQLPTPGSAFFSCKMLLWSVFFFFSFSKEVKRGGATPLHLILASLFPGVPVNRLFWAAADLRGECERRAGGRGVLRRPQESPGPALHPGRVWHLPESVPEGVPDGGRHHRGLHLRSRIYAGSRREYVFFQGRQEQREERRSRKDRDSLPVRLGGEWASPDTFILRRSVVCAHLKQSHTLLWSGFIFRWTDKRILSEFWLFPEFQNQLAHQMSVCTFSCLLDNFQ